MIAVSASRESKDRELYTHAMSTFVFDVGETLITESRMWTRHAHRLGVPPFTFFAVFGALLERGEDHRAVFAHFGVDVGAYLAGVDALDDPADGILPEDLYPDVVPTLRELRARGHHVGIAANQPRRAAQAIADLGLPVDFIGISSEWGVSKPSPEFFDKVLEVVGQPADEVVYIGDRIDNDVSPAKAAGMRAVLIRRGPWGELEAASAKANLADQVISTLSELL